MRSAIVRASAAAVLALATVAAAPDNGTTTEALALGTLVKASFTTADGRVVRVESAIYPRELVTFRVLDWPFGGPPGETVRRSLQAGVLAAVDGGYIVNGHPDGLLEIGGRVHEPPVARLSGVVGRAKDDTPVVAPVRDVEAASLRDAIQSGPFVVDPGGAIGIRRDDGTRARRALVIVGDGSIGFAITSDCGLSELARALVASPRVFGVERVERALNLSGDGAAGLAVRLPNDRVESVPELARLRTVLQIVKRASATAP